MAILQRFLSVVTSDATMATWNKLDAIRLWRSWVRLYLFILYVCACRLTCSYVLVMCVYVEFREKLAGVSSLTSTCQRGSRN